MSSYGTDWGFSEAFDHSYFTFRDLAPTGHFMGSSPPHREEGVVGTHREMYRKDIDGSGSNTFAAPRLEVPFGDDK